MQTSSENEENRLDERIMNIVSLIADQVQTRKELFRDEGRIMDTLMSSGYHLHEADATLTLMQSLAGTGGDAGEDARPAEPAGMRAMSTQERARFSIEAFGFISKLATLGVITEDEREAIIEKSLALHRGRVLLDEVKSLLALSLFTDGREPEDPPVFAADSRGALWN
jgi:Smg protein